MKNGEVKSHVLHDGLFPSDIRIVFAYEVVRYIARGILVETNLRAKSAIRAIEGCAKIVIACLAIRSAQFQHVDPRDALHELLIEDLPSYGCRGEPGILLIFEKLVGTVPTHGRGNHIAIQEIKADAPELGALLVTCAVAAWLLVACSSRNIVITDHVVDVIVCDSQSTAMVEIPAHTRHGVNGQFLVEEAVIEGNGGLHRGIVAIATRQAAP